jgi:hypothetical protein
MHSPVTQIHFLDKNQCPMVPLFDPQAYLWSRRFFGAFPYQEIEIRSGRIQHWTECAQLLRNPMENLCFGKFFADCPLESKLTMKNFGECLESILQTKR